MHGDEVRFCRDQAERLRALFNECTDAKIRDRLAGIEGMAGKSKGERRFVRDGFGHSADAGCAWRNIAASGPCIRAVHNRSPLKKRG
jgi:hypothetical protein